jgi:hypothetical protein
MKEVSKNGWMEQILEDSGREDEGVGGEMSSYIVIQLLEKLTNCCQNIWDIRCTDTTRNLVKVSTKHSDLFVNVLRSQLTE